MPANGRGQGTAPPSPLIDHVIVLIQPEADKYSRTFYDFETGVQAALGGICDLFENRLRELNRSSGFVELKYEVADLFRFIDALPDLSMFVFDNKTHQYTPYGKNFIKNELFKFCQERHHGHRRS